MKQQQKKKQLFPFAYASQDKNGVLDRAELTNVVRETMLLIDPERAGDEELIEEATDKLFLRMDANNDGVVSKEEYIKAFADSVTQEQEEMKKRAQEQEVQ